MQTTLPGRATGAPIREPPSKAEPAGIQSRPDAVDPPVGEEVRTDVGCQAGHVENRTRGVQDPWPFGTRRPHTYKPHRCAPCRRTTEVRAAPHDSPRPAELSPARCVEPAGELHDHRAPNHGR